MPRYVVPGGASCWQLAPGSWLAARRSRSKPHLVARAPPALLSQLGGPVQHSRHLGAGQGRRRFHHGVAGLQMKVEVKVGDEAPQ